MKSNKRPEVRFLGFTEDWEERNLKEVSERVRGNDGRMDLPTLTISAASGWLDQRERFSGNIAGNEQKNYTLLSKGELSYNHGNSKLAKYGVVFVLRTFEEALVPKIYHSFKMTEEASADFIENMFATKKPDKELAKLISSGARMDGLLNINYEEFVSINITIPKIEEQRKIAKFLRDLENAIILQQQELDTLKQTKQGFLQKMFPKEGESVPELRFPGFIGEWKKCRLADETKIIAGGDIDRGKISVTGKYPVLANALTNDGIVGYYENEYRIEAPAVTVTGRGDVGHAKARRFSFTPVVRLLAIKSDHDVYFLENAINNHKVVIESTGVPQLTSPQLGNYQIYFSSFDEEKKIGEFFRNINNVIALQQQELDALKKTKKAFLQKMFV